MSKTSKKTLAEATRQAIRGLPSSKLKEAKPRDIYVILEGEGWPQDLTMRSTVSKLLKEAKISQGNETTDPSSLVGSVTGKDLPGDSESRDHARRLLYETYNAYGGDIELLCEELASLRKWAPILMTNRTDTTADEHRRRSR
jgi:hypothetical protein